MMNCHLVQVLTRLTSLVLLLITSYTVKSYMFSIFKLSPKPRLHQGEAKYSGC